MQGNMVDFRLSLRYNLDRLLTKLDSKLLFANLLNRGKQMEMDRDINPTTLKLMQAFRELYKSTWHDRPVAGCKPSEIRVLFCIRHGKMKVSEISKLLHVTSPSVTQLLKGLEANGLIERHIDPVDRRAVGVKLTEQGETLIKQSTRAFTQSMDGLVEHLGEEESQQLAELLSKALRYFSMLERTILAGNKLNIQQFQGNGDGNV
jgi:DNA-binding MarR family transcriptional regulator